METENEGTCKFASNAMWQVLENAEPTSVSCVHLVLSSQVTHIEGTSRIPFVHCWGWSEGKHGFEQC